MPTTSPLTLTPQISALVTGALYSGSVLLLAAVDPSGKPLLSFRGSTAVYSDTQRMSFQFVVPVFNYLAVNHDRIVLPLRHGETRNPKRSGRSD
jgi:hypothetical protein